MDLGALQSRAQSGKKAVSNVECTCSNQQMLSVADIILSVHGSIECAWIALRGQLATVYGRHSEQGNLRIIKVIAWCLA